MKIIWKNLGKEEKIFFNLSKEKTCITHSIKYSCDIGSRQETDCSKMPGSTI